MTCCGKNEKLFSGLILAGKSVLKHIVDPNYNAFSTEEEKNKRLEICNSCESQELFFGKKRCKVCKCFVEAKASLKEQRCPHPKGDKWP